MKRKRNKKDKETMSDKPKAQDAKHADEVAHEDDAPIEVDQVEEVVVETEEKTAEEAHTLPSLEEAMETIARFQLENRQLKETVADLEDQHKRLQADFINFRKRKEKEASENIRYANVDLLKALLPILDNFDRTLDAIEKTDNLAAVKDGIGLVSNSLRKQLTKVGLEPISIENREFDPALHEAITTVPVEEEDKKGQIFEFVEKGYKLKDRVIRYAKVVVGE